MRPEESRDTLDDFTEHVARRAKLAELGEKTLAVCKELDDGCDSDPDSFSIAGDTILNYARSLGLLPGEEAKGE